MAPEIRKEYIRKLRTIRKLEQIFDENDQSLAGTKRLNEALAAWGQLEADGTITEMQRLKQAGELTELFREMAAEDAAIKQEADDELEQLRRMAFGKDNRK